MRNKEIKYNDIDWNTCKKKLAKLQYKILEAWRKGNKTLVYKLQETLVSTFEARALAVRKVTTNSGNKTPGVDNVIIEGTEAKMNMIHGLKSLTQYQASPVRRVMIPKSNGKMRPLGIPTIYDRCVQALYHFALDPIAEETADTRSYGFRKGRSTQDVQKYLRQVLALDNRARWILDGDIKGFFDNISHEWIMKNIPINKKILNQWLNCGHITLGNLAENRTGVPQGGIISPTIANMVLDGLEQLIEEFSNRITKERKKEVAKEQVNPKINYVRYADDFIVTARSKDYLIRVIQEIDKFLKERGVELNKEKTKIYNIREGFNFLGFNFKKYTTTHRKKKEILLIKPSKTSRTRIITKIRKLFKTFKNVKELLSELNPVLRGWGNYFRYVNSYRIFSILDTYIFNKTLRWLHKKYPKVPIRKLFRKYFQRERGKRWVFGYTEHNKEFKIFRLETIKVKLYIMIKTGINPYDPKYKEYLQKREFKEWLVLLRPVEYKLYTRQKGLCPVCNSSISKIEEEDLEIHHILPVKSGGTNNLKNLALLHKICHQNVTNCKDPNLIAEYIKKGILKMNSK